MTGLQYKRLTQLIAALIALAIITGMLTGCRSLKSARGLLKHADKDIKAAIAKGAQVNNDTLWRTLEIPVPFVSTDTVFKSSPGDTVILEKDRLKITYISRYDTVYLYGECMADTIYQDVYHTITKNITVPEKSNKWKWIALALAVIIVIALILRR